MEGHIEASVAGVWLAVSVKCALLYLAVGLVSMVFWRQRPAWRTWGWLMVLVSFAVLTGLESLSGGLAEAIADPVLGLGRLPSTVVPVYSFLTAVLLGLVIESLVRLTLLKRHSPPLSLDFGLQTGDQALGPAMRLLRQTHFCGNDAARVPTSFGVFRPTVVLPTAIEGAVYRYVVRAAVLHEFLAVVRFDALWTLLARITQCFYFLNPVVWLAFRHYRRASEQVRDDWSAYAMGDANEYASNLAQLAGPALRSPSLALDTPMAECADSRHLSARLSRLAGRGDIRPGAISRPQLMIAVLAWFGSLAVMASVQVSPTASGGIRFRTDPPAFWMGLVVAILVGAGLLVGTIGARRGPWRRALADPDAPGVYRQTVAWCVQRVERDWQAMQPMLSLAGRTAVPAVVVALLAGVAITGLVVAVLHSGDQGTMHAYDWRRLSK